MTAARTSATARRAHHKDERPDESHHHPFNARLRILGDRPQPVDKKTSYLVVRLGRRARIAVQPLPRPADLLAIYAHQYRSVRRRPHRRQTPGPCHGATDLRGGANLGEHRWGQSHLTQPPLNQGVSLGVVSYSEGGPHLPDTEPGLQSALTTWPRSSVESLSSRQGARAPRRITAGSRIPGTGRL